MYLSDVPEAYFMAYACVFHIRKNMLDKMGLY